MNGGCRSVVSLRLKTAPDWIKVYASRGSFDSVDTTQTITFDEMKACKGPGG